MYIYKTNFTTSTLKLDHKLSCHSKKHEINYYELWKVNSIWNCDICLLTCDNFAMRKNSIVCDGREMTLTRTVILYKY